MEQPGPLNRRQFIRRASACAAMSMTGIASTLFDLRLINAVMAQGSPEDYKALVCVFLSGGNDANNWLIPRSGSDYTAYAAARQNLALAQGSLLALNPLVGDGRDYGLHPNCAGLQNLFNTGKLAFLRNVGPLVAPTTRAAYLAGSAPKPLQLFSHSDQVMEWQSSISDVPSRTGWGGRCADLLYSVNAGAQVSMSISLAGFNTWEVGNIISQYQVSTSGSIGLTGLSTNQVQALKDILAYPRTNLYEKTFATISQTAILNNELLTSALNSAPALTTVFPTTSLGNQLKMIARLISARSALSMKRQIFFCSLGGFDTHGEQLTTQGNLLSDISQSVSAFYNATVELGIPDKVTTFSASDFNRTYPSNGIGSDHGWGGHHFILGNAVLGQTMFGSFPTLAVNGPDDTSTGRWIPTTSVDEYAATLARWFGVSESNLDVVFPNLYRFPHRNLGFML